MLSFFITQVFSIFGTVEPPPGVSDYDDVEAGGLTNFISNIIRLLIVGAGVYVIFNIITAGYDFMSAGDDPKKLAGARDKITKSLLGLLVTAGALVIVAIISRIFFGDFFYLLRLRVFGPN